MRLLMANDQSSQRNASDATCIDRCLDRVFVLLQMVASRNWAN